MPRTPRTRLARELALLGWCVLFLGACASNTTPVSPPHDASTDTPSAPPAELPSLSTSLVEGEWRLFSLIFSRLPRDGYPIGFEPDGVLHTRNLALAKTWTLSEEGTLLLASVEGRALYSLAYDASAGIFLGREGDIPPALIAPAGFDFDGYLQEEARLAGDSPADTP